MTQRIFEIGAYVGKPDAFGSWEYATVKEVKPATWRDGDIYVLQDDATGVEFQIAVENCEWALC